MTAPRRQLTRSDLEHMTPQAVAAATLAGRCNVILGGKAQFDQDAPRLPDKDTGTPAEWKAALAKITDEELETATANGQIPDFLLADPEPEPIQDIDQGARGDGQRRAPLQQLLHCKSPAEIARMTNEGRFDAFLKGEGPHS